MSRFLLLICALIALGCPAPQAFGPVALPQADGAANPTPDGWSAPEDLISPEDAAEDAAGDAPATAEVAQPLVDAGPECTEDDDCEGGTCIKGACCPTAEQACGAVCCEAGYICFASGCVVPGDDCFSQADCPKASYCEPALGDPALFVEPPEGLPGCLEPPPVPGKCLELPKICEEGEPPASGCLEKCEFKPEPGTLNVVTEWSWGLAGAVEHPTRIDVWSTPVVGRMHDSNCDGKVNELDPPVVLLVSADSEKTCCSCGSTNKCKRGVLRMLGGREGEELWSNDLPEEGSKGFSGVSMALGDTDGDGFMDIAAVTGEGKLALINRHGKTMGVSAEKIPEASHASFGWGGGLAMADMDGDGWVEVAYGSTVFKTAGKTPTLWWTGKGRIGGGPNRALSVFVDLDKADNLHQELLAGPVAYKSDGTILWDRSDLPEGFPAVGDMDGDLDPDVVLVAGGSVYVLEGATGETLFTQLALEGGGSGGPPTVADFDGDGKPEIGVATKKFYNVVEPEGAALKQLWKATNHDLSSSVTGSTVFDFEADGSAEVIYADECFLWVYDGKTGAVRFATQTTSFTATEAPIVADVDGDGKAEIVMVSNGANPSADGWKCDVAPWNKPDGVRPAWVPPDGAPAYRGVTVFGDAANSWVGTRTLWNQHAYSVTNVCGDDTACGPPNDYGHVPKYPLPNWVVPWLNNFRQNVQEDGLWDAPDATVLMSVACTTPLTFQVLVRNLGQAILPKAVQVGIYQLRPEADGGEIFVGQVETLAALFPGQVELVGMVADEALELSPVWAFVARILVDPENPEFRECRPDNNNSPEASSPCLGVTSP